MRKTHKRVFYFSTFEEAREFARKHGFPTNRILAYTRGWAIQLKAGGDYVGPHLINNPFAINASGRTMRVHTLLFDKRSFTPHQAKAWAHAHGYRVGQMEVSPAGRYVHLVQTPRTGRVTRIIPIGSTLSGIRAIVTRNPLCCP